MPEKRVTVWVQRFKDRPQLMLQWTDPDTGKRKSKSAQTADEKEAEQARADLEYELNHGKYQEASRMSWERFRELFEEEYAGGRRKGTQNVYRDTLDAFERLCGPKALRAVTERTLSAFVASLRKEPGTGGNETLAPSTIKVRLQFLRTALRWAADQKLIPAAPKFPTIKVPKKKPQPVAAELFERMLAVAPDEVMRAFLLTGWLAGLRLAEAVTLEWERTDAAPWLNPEAGRIVLPAELVKAGEDQWVPLDPELQDVLAALPRQGRRVFTFVSRYAPATPAAVGQRVIALAKRAGVKLTMRTLRRGFGCSYAAEVPAQVLQRLMRHADIKTTMAYYANVDQAAEDAVRQRNARRNSAAGAALRDDANTCGARENG